jgi:hypothetical protein
MEWTPSQSNAVDGIGRAFFATLARGAHPVFSTAGIFVALVLLVLLVRWIK